MNLNTNQVTVTQGRWIVSFDTSSEQPGVRLSVFITRHADTGIGVKFQHGNGDGQRFATSADAKRYALEHGYIVPYVHGICPHCRIVHRFMGRRSNWCDVTHSFVN